MSDLNGMKGFDTGDFTSELAKLYGELCVHEKKAFDIRREMDRVGFERSLNMEFYREEIAETEKQKALLAAKIEELERKKFGEEIPRTKSGSLSVPLEEMILTQVQNQVNDAFKGGGK